MRRNVLLLLAAGVAAFAGLPVSCMPTDYGERFLADLGRGVGKAPQNDATPAAAPAEKVSPAGAPVAEGSPAGTPARLAAVLDGSLPGAWPQWRGPGRNGISAEKHWRPDWTADPPTVAWTAKVGRGHSTVVVSKGRVYALGADRTHTTVYCLGAETGELIWKYAYERREKVHPEAEGDVTGPASTPLVDGERVFALDDLGDLHCLDTATGEVRWRLSAVDDLKGQAPDQFFGSPLVVGGTLFLDVGPMVALDKTTGRVFWKGPEDKHANASPAVFQAGDRALVAYCNRKGLVVRRATDGREAARADVAGDPKILAAYYGDYNTNATPVVQDNQVFVSTALGGARYEMTKTGLRRVWFSESLCAHVATPILSGGCLYGFSGQVTGKDGIGAMVCVDFATGKCLWRESDIAAASYIMADGKLIIMDQKGDLVVAQVSPEGCKELGRIRVLKGRGAYEFMATPVLAGGRIYCRNHAGDLVCLDVRAKFLPDETAAAGAKPVQEKP
jgi:outer membrane protein assembly factor BamB